jgi:hypothetical protein
MGRPGGRGWRGDHIKVAWRRLWNADQDGVPDRAFCLVPQASESESRRISFSADNSRPIAVLGRRATVCDLASEEPPDDAAPVYLFLSNVAQSPLAPRAFVSTTRAQ